MTPSVYEERNKRCPWIMRPRQVLDLHADLQRMLSNMPPNIRQGMINYGLEDASKNKAWGPSHLNPATRWDDLSPWLHSLGTDLFGANTYQVTEEMIELAEAMLETTPGFEDIKEEELPSDWGFMWLDKPLLRPSVEDLPGQDPLLMHAISWARIPRLPIDIRIREQGEGEPAHLEGPPEQALSDEIVKTVHVPAVRIREWGWCDDRDIEPRPLHLMGQSVVVLTENVHTPLKELHLVHMIWIIMGMELAARTRVTADRAGHKRAANLRHHQVDVISLRRRAHGEPTGEHRHIDWKCTWLVRGHWRKAPNGMYSDGRTRTWVRPYIKGPDGMPLKASDVLYKLSR